MFRETHYDDQLPKKPYKKPAPKHPLDTQTNLLADFQSLDAEEVKYKEMEAKCAKFFGSQDYYTLSEEEKESVREAYFEDYKKRSAAYFREKVKNSPKSYGERFREVLNQQREANPEITYSEASSIAKQIVDEEWRPIIEDREKRVAAYWKKVNPPRSSNLPEDDSLSEADHIDENGFIKDDKPGDMYRRR